jgi:hypothetical protein
VTGAPLICRAVGLVRAHRAAAGREGAHDVLARASDGPRVSPRAVPACASRRQTASAAGAAAAVHRSHQGHAGRRRGACVLRDLCLCQQWVLLLPASASASASVSASVSHGFVAVSASAPASASHGFVAVRVLRAQRLLRRLESMRSGQQANSAAQRVAPLGIDASEHTQHVAGVRWRSLYMTTQRGS